MSKLVLKDTTKNTLKELIIQLKRLGVSMAEADFNGSGDEGSFDKPIFLDAGKKELVVDDAAKESTEQAFSSVLDDYGYDWYNNDGGYGSVTLNVTKGTIDVDMNINEQSSTSHPAKAKL